MPSTTAGTTNRSEYFYIVGDSSHASPGDPVTGLLFSDIETGGSASYMRQGATRTDLTLITQTVAGAHSDGGFVEVDATNMPGVYRCDYPDAAYATGVDFVVCQIVVASANNAVAAPIQVDITDFDLRNAKVTVEALDAGVITSAAYAAGAINAAALNADARTYIMDKVIEDQGSYTVQQALSIVLSVLAGETNTGGTIFRTPNDAATRVTSTVDASDNRTAMTLTPSAGA